MTKAGDDTPEERLRLKIEAYHEAALVYTAVKLGLPDAMAAKPVTVEHLAPALGLSAPHLTRFLRGLCLVERDDLGIDARLTHPPRDQLRHLAAEIDDEDFIVLGGLGRHGIG